MQPTARQRRIAKDLVNVMMFDPRDTGFIVKTDEEENENWTCNHDLLVTRRIGNSLRRRILSSSLYFSTRLSLSGT